jgi:long-chain acyl-CoA synthetase
MNTFADPLRRAVQIAAGRPAVIDGNAIFTHKQLFERCARLGNSLARFGLEPGDRVAILAGNGHQFIEAYLGVPAAGFVIVPLNTRHAAPEIEYALRDSGARILLTDREPGEFAAFGDLVDHVIRFGPDYESLLASAMRLTVGEGVFENDLAGLFYTGGTTGEAKGVMLSHRNLIANALHWMAAVHHRGDDRWLVMSPLFHAAGSLVVLPAVWSGAAMITLRTFDPAPALDLIEKHHVTAAPGVPTMLAALAEEQNARPRQTGSLRLLAHGGAPIAGEVIRRVHQAFPSADLVEVYGATELSPLATALTGEQNFSDGPRAQSCGQALPGVEVRVRDGAARRELPRGEVGEIVVRGANVMQGYWNKPEETAAVLRDDGYWSGDLGFMDDEGFLFLVDRSKDMIVSGGENVYSTEVEEVLYRHAAVLEAAVFGVPDEKWGEAVYAVVVTREEHAEVDPRVLIEFCREHIAGYKVPKTVEVRREPLPKSGAGKVLKRELRAPFWRGEDRGVH